MARQKGLGVSIWDPRTDIVRMYRSLGMAHYKIAPLAGVNQNRSSLLTRRFPDPPSIELRMHQAPTQQAKALTANLAALTLLVRAQPIPRLLRPHLNLRLVSPRSAIRVKRAMINAGHGMETLEYHVTQELAPALLNPRFAHVPHTLYKQREPDPECPLTS